MSTFSKLKHILKHRKAPLLLAALVLVLLLGAKLSVFQSHPFTSVEVAVAEYSPTGTTGGAVVPASCPSYAHTYDAAGNRSCPICTPTQIFGQTTTIQCDGNGNCGSIPIDTCQNCPAGTVANADNTECVTPCAANAGQTCTGTNACGTLTGTYQCDGTCSVGGPTLPSGYGNSCTSAPNSCAQTNSGTIGCNGSCNASTPPDSNCSVCTITGQTCVSPPNSCGQTNTGHVTSTCTCDATTPPDTNCPSGTALFDLEVNGSKNPPPVLAGQNFYFTWSSQNVQNCTPHMLSGSDSWWTSGAGVSVGGYLPNAYGNISSYQSTGLAHSLNAGGTYTYLAQCQSTVGVAPQSWLERLVQIPIAWASTLYSSVPVTVTVCAFGQIIQGGVCVTPPNPVCPTGYTGTPPNCVGGSCPPGYAGTPPNCTITPTGGAEVHITAPTRVRFSSTATLTWWAFNVTDCTLSGPGTSDAATADGNGTVATKQTTSAPITGQSQFTATCQSNSGAVSASATVNLIPNTQEI